MICLFLHEIRLFLSLSGIILPMQNAGRFFPVFEYFIRGTQMKMFSSRDFPFPIHSLHIMHKGKLIQEEYFAPYEKGRMHRMFSITKSFTSLAVGALIAEGKLSLSDPICKYFPEYTPADADPFLMSMTVQDLLMMRTCHKATTKESKRTEGPGLPPRCIFKRYRIFKGCLYPGGSLRLRDRRIRNDRISRRPAESRIIFIIIDKRNIRVQFSHRLCSE